MAATTAESLHEHVGATVSIVLQSGATVKGEVQAVSKKQGALTLVSPAPSGNTARRAVNVIAVPFIKDITMEKAADPASKAPLVMPDLNLVKNRERLALEQARSVEQRVGKGVSTEGQKIFNALYKTLPTRWAGDNIVVMDEIVVQAPYKPENAVSPRNDAAALSRVRKILEHERKRLFGE
eukprot:Clim_evm32s34 gene=Clim_evmTU32s34